MPGLFVTAANNLNLFRSPKSAPSSPRAMFPQAAHCAQGVQGFQSDNDSERSKLLKSNDCEENDHLSMTGKRRSDSEETCLAMQLFSLQLQPVPDRLANITAVAPAGRLHCNPSEMALSSSEKQQQKQRKQRDSRQRGGGGLSSSNMRENHAVDTESDRGAPTFETIDLGDGFDDEDVEEDIDYGADSAPSGYHFVSQIRMKVLSASSNFKRHSTQPDHNQHHRQQHQNYSHHHDQQQQHSAQHRHRNHSNHQHHRGNHLHHHVHNINQQQQHHHHHHHHHSHHYHQSTAPSEPRQAPTATATASVTANTKTTAGNRSTFLTSTAFANRPADHHDRTQTTCGNNSARNGNSQLARKESRSDHERQPDGHGRHLYSHKHSHSQDHSIPHSLAAGLHNPSPSAIVFGDRDSLACAFDRVRKNTDSNIASSSSSSSSSSLIPRSHRAHISNGNLRTSTQSQATFAAGRRIADLDDCGNSTTVSDPKIEKYDVINPELLRRHRERLSVAITQAGKQDTITPQLFRSYRVMRECSAPSSTRVGPDTITVEPAFFDASVQSQTLIVNRTNGSIHLKAPALSEYSTQQSSEISAYGIMGMIRLNAGYYLILVTSRERVGQLRGAEVFRLTGVRLLPVFKSSRHLNETQESDDAEYLRLLSLVLPLDDEKVISTTTGNLGADGKIKSDDARQSERLERTPGAFYFSYAADLTNSIQRKEAIEKERAEWPLFKKADDLFYWNKYLQRPLIELTERDPDQDLSAFILPMIHGLVEIRAVTINSRDFDYVLISRRGCKRAGTRYNMRGVDMDGHAANFAETEQIIVHNGHVLSHLQTRGSVPIFWKQVPNVKYTPKLVVGSAPAHVNEAAKKHLETQLLRYGPQILVNLVNKKGYELPLAQAYANAVSHLRNPNLRYIHFDFHHECRKMRFDRVSVLIDEIRGDLENQGYFHKDVYNRVLRTQTSIVRTNCIDCLDRTNVVQSVIARQFLGSMLRELQIVSKEESLDNHRELDRILKNIWADNADAISYHYSGTGALKTDFTRTGKRTSTGAVQDFCNSAIRYIKNNYFDGARQDAFDLLLGVYQIHAAKPSPFRLSRESRPLKYILLPSALVVSIFMILVTVTLQGHYGWFGNLYILFWGFVGAYAFHLIIKNGHEFVDNPRLVPRAQLGH